ncbi:Cobalt/zinc/cadmium efflux RND transporter, membrane fusion protein, CzcB family [hydrothermal vent metagenome]|uniref:Cobalt/zinc/cadmium efflux RND transporter, membrane fusion protein, CzcB family n=1 Tax=hydrothermal vent metagenome TaxID=652676 RepID=A0A3B0W266_9ZZZZ
MKSRKVTTLAIALVLFILAVAVMWRMGFVESAAIAQDKHAEAKHGDDKHSEEQDKSGHDEHDDHDEDKKESSGGHDGHDEEEEDIVRLSKEEMKEFGIELATAGPGKLHVYASLSGEVVPNADRLAHIVPRMNGIVREVRKTLGEKVRTGEVMAVIESRELADIKSAYLAAKERILLADATFKREEKLWKKKISPEREYLEARQLLADAKIKLRSTEQKLHALGFSDKYMEQLPAHSNIAFTRYEITAPFEGTVIEKHVALGEAVEGDSKVFVVADLSSVWIDLDIYQKDLSFIEKGQSVVISAGHGIPDVTSRVSYVGPLVGEETRTALARVVLPNKAGKWRPGLFVTALVATSDTEMPIVVPKASLQMVEERVSIFVQTEGGFEPRAVKTGKEDKTQVEITSGLKPGERYVMKGAFMLKAQASKGAFESGHSH